MSRGLTDTPEPDNNGVTLNDLDAGLQDLAGYVAMLSARLETLEDVIAKAIKFTLPEEEAADRKRIKGL